MRLWLSYEAMTASSRALLRVREEMTERRLSQRDLAETLKCSQSRIAKIMNGGVNLRVDDLNTLATAVGISLTEACRDRGVEFCAEMTPTELRVLERMRRRPNVLHAVMMMLDMDPTQKPSPTVPKKRTPGRPVKNKPEKLGA